MSAMNFRIPARGFTLVELMIAITLTLFVIAGLVLLFTTSSSSARQLDQSARQIENGQYALSQLGFEFNHAGYLSYFSPDAPGIVTPAAIPNPCLTAIADLRAALPLHIQGYDGGNSALACAPNQVAGSDVVVIRRAAVCASGSLDCPVVSGAPYFQASSCQSNLELASPDVNNHFRLTYTRSELNRTRRNCTTAEVDRRYIVNILYVRDHYQTVGDGIPTLVSARLGAGGFERPVPIAAGIETMQLEYGIDGDGDGAPERFTADPNNAIDPMTAAVCTLPVCAQLWRDTVAVKAHLLARTTRELPGKPDEKTFTLGLDADGEPFTVDAADDQFRRNVYQTLARLNNPAMRRE